MNKKNDAIQTIGLGQACVDYLGRLNAFPHEDGKAELTDLHIQCGGPASTALVTLSRLGISTSFLGSISDDPFGVKILNNLKKEKIDASCLKITPGHTSQFAFIAVTKEGGKRTIFWHRGTAPHLKKSDVCISRFPKARIFHTDGLMVEASIEAARQAKSLGMTVVMDAGTMRGGAKELCKLVNILIASETFATPLVGSNVSDETALYALRELGPEHVVITLGARGSIGLNEKGIVHQKAFPVSTVDTTGAGDVYHGGYIYGLLNGWGMQECMRFASATAALKCAEIGSQSGIPNLKDINALLRVEATSQ
ncbi:MAG: PfkB family carbohydrate kinase [Desulfobacterales bacterium]|nr:PfkB family carbohydrate kinase [Desulfobacterales bacterium]